MTIQSKASSREMEPEIAATLERRFDVHDQAVALTVCNGDVMPSGPVPRLWQRALALKSSLKTRGVRVVTDNWTIDPMQTSQWPARSAGVGDKLVTQGQTLLASPAKGYRGVKEASDLLRRLFRGFSGRLVLRLWNGSILRVGASEPETPDPPFTLVLRNPNVVYSMVMGRDPLRLADAYFRGDMDIEGDFFKALNLKDHLDSICIPLRDRFSAVFTALRLRALNECLPRTGVARTVPQGRVVKTHSKAENRDAIQFHYDLSNEFYALWLDEDMVYSCAYFGTVTEDLDDAQQAKLDHICRKLLLTPGDRFLDIGCGWGALLIHAARAYGVQAHGVTLSRQQWEFARHRIARAGLQDQVTVELGDYRELLGDSIYDKVASIGMFEHVGLQNLPVYFSTVHRLLKPLGLFLNHGITSDVEGGRKTVSTEFINRYVFPDGQLDTISSIQRVMESAKWEIADVEGLRAHYALTLRCWVKRLERHHAQALQYVTESTYRVWRLYMTACALQFESGEIGIYQVLASKRSACPMALPLTRKYM